MLRNLRKVQSVDVIPMRIVHQVEMSLKLHNNSRVAAGICTFNPPKHHSLQFQILTPNGLEQRKLNICKVSKKPILTPSSDGWCKDLVQTLGEQSTFDPHDRRC